MSLTIADAEIEALAGRLQMVTGAKSVEDALRKALRNELRRNDRSGPRRTAEQKRAAIDAARLQAVTSRPAVSFDMKAMSDELWNDA